MPRFLGKSSVHGKWVDGSQVHLSQRWREDDEDVEDDSYLGLWPVLPELQEERLHHPPEGELGGAVGDEVGGAGDAGHAGHADDVALEAGVEGWV